jgi:hypothetical protein
MDVVTVNPSRVFGEGPITDSNTVSKMINGYLKGKWRIIPGDGGQISNYSYLMMWLMATLPLWKKALRATAIF